MNTLFPVMVNLGFRRKLFPLRVDHFLQGLRRPNRKSQKLPHLLKTEENYEGVPVYGMLETIQHFFNSVKSFI